MDLADLSADEVALRCFAGGDESAWAEFVRRFHPLIARVVLRVARQLGETSPLVVDDLIQDTYLKLCTDGPSLSRHFKADHKDAVFGYIKVFTTNLVRDHFRAVYSQKRGGGKKSEPADDQALNATSVSCASSTNSMEREVLLGQIDACLRDAECGPNAARDRRIFWLHYRVGLSASAISALPAIGLSTKGVESAIFRMTRVIRQRLTKAADSSELDIVPGKGIRPAESL